MSSNWLLERAYILRTHIPVWSVQKLQISLAHDDKDGNNVLAGKYISLT